MVPRARRRFAPRSCVEAREIGKMRPLRNGQKVLVLDDTFDSTVRCRARLRPLPLRSGHNGAPVWQAIRDGDDFLIDRLAPKDEGIIWLRGWADPEALLAAYLLAMS